MKRVMLAISVLSLTLLQGCELSPVSGGPTTATIVVFCLPIACCITGMLWKTRRQDRTEKAQDSAMAAMPAVS